MSENQITITLTTKYKIKDDFILREIGGEVVIIPTNDSSLVGNGMLSPNETGAFIWKQFTHPSSIEEVTNKCLEEYDATVEQIQPAIINFVAQSLQLKIIEEVL